MTDSHEITKSAPVAMEYRSQRVHPVVEMIKNAGGQLDTATMREMLQLQREYEAGEARKEFTAAMVRLKANLPSVIEKDKIVKFNGTEYQHASLANIMDAVTPCLSKHGFSISWTPKNTDKDVSVTCTVTHADGHREETTITAPHDKSGSKNAVQAIGSTITYLQRYSALSLLGIATADMDDADDKSKNTNNKTDSKRALIAVGKLQGVGVSLDAAQEFVGKPIIDWTGSDIDDLVDLYKKEKAANAAAEKE